MASAGRVVVFGTGMLTLIVVGPVFGEWQFVPGYLTAERASDKIILF